MGTTLLWVLMSLIAVSFALVVLPSVLWALGIFFVIILVVYILWFFINFIVWVAPVVFFIALVSIIWGMINKATGKPTGFKGGWFKFSNKSKKHSNKKSSSVEYEIEKDKILDDLNNGNISVEEAMKRLEELKNKYM